MPTSFSPRDNDPQELDRFKQSIDLVEYATARHGYDVKKTGPRGNWHQLEREGEMLIVSRKAGGHQVYLNPGDDRDSGSIIDFVKTREQQTLGQVRQTLRQYLGEPEQGWDAATTPKTPPPAAVAARPAPGVAPPAGEPAGETEEQRRARLVAAVLGTQAGLTDRTYLHGRGLRDETIDAPAFQGRVFTSQQGPHQNTAFPLYNEHGIATVEQRGEGYKNLLALPKTGVWVSHPTEGVGTPVERLVVAESPVDAMSYHQLRERELPEAAGPRPNTLYVATSGTVTERQVELIQRLIDKQQPREVVLANDNDAAGRRFNINYLNELHPPRQARELNAGQVAYDEAPRPVEWHATAVGKYHTALRVEFHHDSRAEGAAQLAQLTQQVQNLQRAAGGEETAVEVQRATRQQTVARLVVPNADAADLEKLAQALLAQREAQREQLMLQPGEPGRQPEGFLRTEYAISKDFNRDLELLSRGLSPQQVAEQARADEQAKEAQRQERARQQLAERQQPAEAAQRSGTPAAGQEPAQQQQAVAAWLSVAAADPSLRRQVLLTVTEPTPTGEPRPSQAQQMEELLRKAGAEVQRRPAPAAEKGQLRSELEVHYHVQSPAPPLRALSQTLDALEKSPLVTLTEDPTRQAERRRLAAEPAPPAATKTALVRIDEPEPAAGSSGRAEAVAEQLRGAGLHAGTLRSSTDEATHQRHSEIQVSYRLDQPELPRVSAALDEAARQPGVQVVEQPGDRAARQQLVGPGPGREAGREPAEGPER